VSEKKLWRVRVEVEVDMVVGGLTQEEAEEWATQNFEKGIEDSMPHVWATVDSAHHLEECPQDWRGAIPYNTGNDNAVESYFPAKEEA